MDIGSMWEIIKKMLQSDKNNIERFMVLIRERVREMGRKSSYVKGDKLGKRREAI